MQHSTFESHESRSGGPRGRASGLGRWLGLVAAAAFAAAPLSAQQTGQVTGQITAGQSGQPLAEVQVSVVGTGVGGLTNAQGRFLLTGVPVGEQTIRAQLIGYSQQQETVTVTAGGTVTVDLTLFSSAVELEGVVVTGTAIAAQRREVGNSIALVTAEDIEASGVATLEDVLRGKALGLTVMGSSGQAGSGSNLVLRGLSSVNGRNQPLIYVDGVRINDQGAYEAAGESQQNATILSSINPEDIERVEVIKGAAASTLYGTEAGAGVIQIFTKQGTDSDAPQWTFTMDQAVSTPVQVGPDSDPTGLHINDCTFGGPLRPEQTEPDPGCPESGSWVRNAHSQDYNLSVRGGSQGFTYFASGGFARQEGIVNAPQNAENINLRANFGFQPWDELQIRLNNSYVRRDINWIPDGDNAEGLMFNVTFLDQGETPNNDDSQVLDLDIIQNIDHFTSGINLSWTPLDNFRHRINAGFDWTNSNQRTDRPFQFWNKPEGDRTVDIENSRLITVDYAGSWAFDLPANLTSTLSWGGQYIDREELGLRGDCEGFVGPGAKLTENCNEITNLNEDRDGFRNGGFFLQDQIGWNNRLFITGGFRADTHSSFGDELDLQFDFAFFPKLQVAYTVSDHDFWPRWWETMRLRGAWGESGEPPPPSASKTTWQFAGADDQPGSGVIIQNLGNPEIGPERTSEFELGMDGSMFGGRLSYQATAFQRETTDGIIFVDLRPSSGVVEAVAFNVGNWESTGFETGLDLVAYESRDFRASLNTRYQFIETEMLNLGVVDGDFSTGYNNRFRDGRPFPAAYGQIVTNPDEVGALPERTDDEEFIGPTTPPHELSLGASFQVGSRLSFDIFGIGQFGHVLIDDQAQELAASGLWPGCIDVNTHVNDWIDAGRPEGGLAPFTAGEIAQCWEGEADNEDWIFDADYFRIQSASVQYRLPESWLPAGLTNALVQFRARNLALFTDFPGIDPDALISPATDFGSRQAGYTLPLPRTYSLNLRVNF